MAISVGRSIKELDAMASEMGLTINGTGKNGRKMKEDYILPIREANLIKRYGSLDNIPKHLSLVLNLKSPMLALRMDSLKQEQIDEVWNDENWDFEQKLNGVRCFIINDGNGIHLYSRHNSEVDLLPICFSDKIMFPENCDFSALTKEFILDCEMTSDNPNICTIMENSGVVTNSQLQAVTSLISSTPARAKAIQKNNNLLLVFNSFDCIYYDKQWIMNEPLTKRREVAEEIIKSLESCGFNIRRVPHTNKNKRDFYNSFVSRGLEGCVAKRLDGLYVADTTRNFSGWLKAKRGLRESLNAYNGNVDMDSLFGDTVDVFITGYEPGTKGGAFEKLVGSVCISVYVQKRDGSLEKREIGKFAGFDLALREDMTEIINGEPTLKASYYNRVVEVDAQQMSARNMRFSHCTFIGFRYDKLPDSCILTEEFLESQMV